jgi:hypothetical protein
VSGGGLRRRRRVGRRERVIGAAAALLVAWLAAPHAVPLYDGVGVPDEPYRYVAPPAGYAKTPAPSSESMTFAAKNGTNTGQGAYVQTKEVSSQCGVYIYPGGLAGPADTTSFKVTLTPQAPSGTTPFGTINGNVYLVQLWAGSAPTATLSAADSDSLQIAMRATSAKIGNATMIYRPVGGQWTKLQPPDRPGTDTWQTLFKGTGQYALIAGGSGGGGGVPVLVIVLVVVVVLALAGALVLIRLSRRTDDPAP